MQPVQILWDARRRRIRAAAVLAAGLGALLLGSSSAQAQFQLGFQDFGFLPPTTTSLAFHAVQTTDASWMRVAGNWGAVAPAGTKEPAGFDPANPADRHYNWSTLDVEVRAATAWHLKILLTLQGAPSWAEGPGRPANPNITGSWDPNPSEYAAFAQAAALRYSGHFPDPLHPGAKLPHVTYWEIWNEENLPISLAAPDLVGEYRAMLNDAYGAIKAVNRRDVVAMGGLAPVSYLPPLSIAPLKFAADLMCLRRVGTMFRAIRSCPRARFDILADHPYSLAATPTKHAYLYDNILVADIGKLVQLLRNADRLHTVARSVSHQLWVTEWSWFTNPPNTLVGDSEPTAARYVAYSMYEMWRAGVQMVIWLFLRDAPNANNIANIAGGGLYTTGGRPKLVLRAFAFPFVAGVSRGRGFAWGRAPQSPRAHVIVERASGRRWKRVATVRTGADGVFFVRFHARGNGRYLARLGSGATSLAYNSRPIPPRRTHLFSTG